MAPSDDKKAGAIRYYKGSKDCTEKSEELLKQVGLPNGRILPDDIEEYGYVKDTGFVWMKWKVKYEFKAIGRLVQYDTEISMKIKEQVEQDEWISEISIDDRASAKICFKSDIGNNKSISGGPSSTNPSPSNESGIAEIKKGSK